MRMSEAEFLNRLNKAFPEKVIFAEQARLSVYLSLFVEIRRYARGTGVSSVQWLTDRGFIWKETGYVEPDMHNVDKCGPSPDYTAFELADYVFRAYPLAGEYQLTDAEDALLYQSVSETVKKVLIDGGRTSVREDAVLVLETINLLKGWSSELADEETSGSLWNYIFLYSLVLEDTSDSIIVPVSGMAWQLELYIPLVHCALMGHNAFKIPGMIWHKSILHDEFVKLELPEGWSGQLMLGISPVPEVSPSYFELGNTLRAITAPQAEYDLWISLENIAGNHINRKITTIACKPTFAAPPIEVIDSTLHWQPEGNYVGDPESTFQVEVQRPGGSIDTYATSTESTALANTSSYALGNYSYQVFLKKKSLFSGGMNELIFKGSYCVGNPLEWLYDGNELIIGDALYWDFETETLKALLMKYGCGILTNLDYQGTTVASGETMPAPCYSATLSFISSTGRRIPFNSKPSNDFELVNPVKVWIVNEHLLILRCTTEDAVYVDKDFSTIVNRNPATYMSKAEQHHRLKTPDYFKYSIREGYQYV